MLHLGDDENEDGFCCTRIPLHSVPTSLPLSIKPIATAVQPDEFQAFSAQQTNMQSNPNYTSSFVSTSTSAFQPPYQLVNQMSIKDKVKPEPVSRLEPALFGQALNMRR